MDWKTDKGLHRNRVSGTFQDQSCAKKRRGSPMSPRVVPSAVLAVLLFSSSHAMAADAWAPQSFCRFVEQSSELINYESVPLLRDEVRTRFEHAAEVSRSDRALYSLSPLLVWANEAKISCAKVYGYLRKPRKWRKRPDYVMLQKCECFYQRMTHYLGR
jgi:hypothetical protein